MYKVLLVDDEILDLEGMKAFIPWNELGMEVVAAVNNGFAAWEIVENEAIDILVTDVRMPNMTGLELAKNALAKQRNLKIVFISGYQDFNYVKQALSLNACNYVLKPMDDSELIDSLLQVRNELDQEKKKLHKENAIKEIFPIVKNEYMLQLLHGTVDPKTHELLLKEYGMDRLSWPLYTAVLEMDDLAWKLPSHLTEQKQRTMEHLYDILSRNIDHLCRTAKERFALLVSEPEQLLEIYGALDRERLPFSITIGVGEAALNWNELPRSYQEANEALDFKMFAGKGRLIHVSEVERTEVEVAQSIDLQLDALLNATATYDLVRIHDELAQLYQLAIKLKSKIVIQSFTMMVITKLDNYLRMMNEDFFEMLELELHDLSIVQQFETIDDIHSWLRRRIYELSEKLQAKNQQKNRKVINEIIDEVKLNLQHNITLKDIADKYFFSPNYLGQLFKETTGRNFSEYIIMLRMEKASELLRKTNAKVYEIADQVGYRYLPYFSKQFKEWSGMSPLEYRRKH